MCVADVRPLRLLLLAGALIILCVWLGKKFALEIGQDTGQEK